MTTPPTGPPPGPTGPPSGSPSGPPTGPPLGPPGAQAPSPVPGRGGAFGSGSSRRGLLAVIALVVVVAIVVAIVATRGSNDNSTASANVELQPVSQPVANPFMQNVGHDESGVTSPSKATTTSAGASTSAASNTAPTAYTGNTPGLYGGTRNVSSCNSDQLVTFLEQHADKAAAWAGVLGIPTTSIRSYVGSLTAMILRADTRVTNHGFRSGRATALQAVLQAGTAVLVDHFGQPVVKCFCGNPLTAPALHSHPKYVGTPWPAFSPTTVIVVQKTTVVINNFTLVDPHSNEPFGRPAGTSGTSDGAPPSSTTTTTAPPSTTSTAAPGTLIDGDYTLTVTPGTYAGCGTISGSPATLSVQGNNAAIHDPSGVTYTGTVDREGGKFHIAASVSVATFTVDGTIDAAGDITGTVILSASSMHCTVPFTGHRK